jgi:LysM repeat protein
MQINDLYSFISNASFYKHNVEEFNRFAVIFECERMNRLIKIVFVSLFFLFFSSFNQSSTDLIDKMIEKNKQIHSLKVSVSIKERVKGKIVEKLNNFIIQVNPFKVYFTEKKYGIDIEGLYIQGKFNNQSLIASKGFPWMKLELDPMGSKMRNDTHHTIFEAGFGYFIGVMEGFKTEYGSKFPYMLSYQGLYQKGSVFFYKILIDNLNFKYVEYIVKKGENLHTIANKYHINDFMILEKNNLSDYFDVKEGQKILIPNDYAKKLIFHLEKNNTLPLYVELYDDQGFYASYGFNNIVVNPKLDDSVFDVSNPNYHFK